MLRQTPGGWSDESHELDPAKDPEGNYLGFYDLPYRPDPVQAVLVDPTGAQGWAVGGFIGPKGEASLSQTSDIERYPADGAAPLGEQAKPVPLQPSEKAVGHPVCEGSCASFAVGGHAVCEDPCAARSRTGVGPQVWLTAALALARKIGAHSFLYTGPSMAEGFAPEERTVPFPFARELEGTASALGTENSASFHTNVAATPQDRSQRPESAGSEGLFVAELGSFLGAEATARGSCTSEAGCQGAYYALPDQGGEHLRVLFLDESSRQADGEQVKWLEEQLRAADGSHEPAIAVGDAKLEGEGWAKPLVAALVGGPGCGPKAKECSSASAYFYDADEEDVQGTLRSGEGSIPEFGSGTLGYEQARNELKSDFHGASGILLAQVEREQLESRTNRAPVFARLIPVIGELALEAKGGTLLPRSRPALFAGLARRPRAGGNAEKFGNDSVTDPYIPIPEECVGLACASGVFPEYTFSSSREDIGNFVKRNTASADPLAVLQGSKGEPVEDPHSGLFCAFNPGTTIVTIEAGGLAASLPVTVEKGSVREPCGTVPLKEARANVEQSPPPPPPPPLSTAPASSPPAAAAPPIPLPPPPAVPPAHAPAKPPAPFVPLAALGAPVLAFVPPPVPTPARPTPPSGTSAVTSPIEVAEEEEEQEEATESASNQAVAYRAPEHEPTPLYVLGVVVLAAFAGAAMRRPRRGEGNVRVAPATISTMRSQRRMEPPRRRGR